MKNYKKIEETLIAFRNGELGLKEAMFVIEGFTTQSYEQRVKDERERVEEVIKKVSLSNKDISAYGDGFEKAIQTIRKQMNNDTKKE